MSKSSTTTLIFTFLFLQLATTTLSTDVRRDSSSKQHPSHAHVASGSWAHDFRPSKPIPEINGASQFIINPGRPRKALTEIASGFGKVAESDGKPTFEQDGPPRFQKPPMKRRKAAEYGDKPTPGNKTPPRFRIQPMKPGKAAESDDKATSEEKAPPRFRIQPVKPHKIERLAKQPIPSQPKRKKPVTPLPEKKVPQLRIQPVKPPNVEHPPKNPIPSQPQRKATVPPLRFHKVTAPTKPDRHHIRRAQPLNPPQAPSPTTAAGKRWCVAKADTNDQVLHANIDYACKKGVDCRPIQKGGDCFNSSSLRSRASFVMNAFYNINGRKDFNCYFGRSAVLTSTDPSYGKCIYL